MSRIKWTNQILTHETTDFGRKIFIRGDIIVGFPMYFSLFKNGKLERKGH